MKYFLNLKIFRSFLGIFICLVLAATVKAQFRFDHWTTDNGLPQNGVRGITQTPDGYLWLTTFDGLVRFDGAKFTVFDKNNSDGISSNRFFLLHQKKDDSLIAGTERDGLTVYRNGIFKSFTTADGLPSNEILEFSTDIHGEFYFLSNVGNFYFRDEKFIPVPDAHIPNEGRFYSAPSGNLWVYDRTGIKQIAPDKHETFYPINFDIDEDFRGMKLFEDRNGNLWVGDRTGVYRLRNGKISKFTESNGIPAGALLRPLIEDNDGNVWFAAWTGIGLVRFNKGKFEVYGKSVGLSGETIDKAFKDREGTIWIVALDRGLNRLEKQFIKSLSTAEGLIHTEVYPLLQTRDGSIYVGTTQGLSRLERNGRFTDVLVKNAEGIRVSVNSLWEDEQNRLWIGAGNGDLFRIENGRVNQIKLGNDETVLAIAKDRAGFIWLGTDRGLIKLKDDKVVERFTVSNGLPSDDVKVVHESRSGELWLGTYGGIAKFENGKFTNFTTADGLASNRVRTIYEDTDGTLWIGTYDGGLSRFADGNFFNYTMESGLFSNGVFHILEDDSGNFWISCNKGIYRVNKKELEDFAAGIIKKINSVAYGKQDGMLNTEANGGRQPAGIETMDGKFWFPTQDGVVVFNPNDISFNPQPPPVQIENVLVEQQTVDFRDGITLQANEDNLEIRYTGISFIKPEQVKFRYRIEGLSDEWTDVGAIREVYFPSLPAGEFTFQVIAANSDGIWNNIGSRLKIRVNAPFWQQTWFIALGCLIAVFIAFMVFRLREKELRRKQFAQQEFSRKLLESQESERKRIASEMHDSLGQYLLAIKNWALFGLNSLSEKDAARVYLREVSETSSLAIEEVREIAHNLRPYQLERLGLTNTLEYMLKNFKNSSKIMFNTEIENIDGFLSTTDEIIFYRIVQESLNNIFKHSHAENVWISIETADENLEFICRDDGTGFDFETAKNSQKSGLGLNGISERVKILKGEYQIISEAEKGTTISVKIPKFNEQRN